MRKQIMPSDDDYAMDLDTQRGIMPYVVKIKGKGDVVPHLQFYKQAADPILAHDPFSSLMWVLFCLPSPFLSSMGSFMSLVHLFYVVCVAQALILYHGKHHFGASELGLSDCALNDICRTLGESELAKQFFVSNHIVTSCNPKDMIRRVTFPYLRRCALLWKLLTSSISVPFYDNYQVWDKVRPYTNNDALDSTSELSIELGGVQELEHMFQISLDLVLKNELRTTILLLRNLRQATWLSPYLDAFGEEDIEMKRGKPLYLSKERYAALTHMV
ncbi:hypothetical protein QJS10_CPB14g01549 [Acorus calamus]|uniref:E3 ubiquitin-protein ligase n=1 Tax=Acorus calamus TaxID=4465 RepID=A0AAV9DBI0_ACOCL|nr:hypothetical protein QJS10_CPB14g01549 [Acorus calamus]